MGSQELDFQPSSVFVIPFSFYSSPKDMLTDFSERRRERERVGEKHRLGASRTHPDWGLNLQPGCVPWLGIEPMTFPFTGQHSNQLSHTGQGSSYLFFMI